MVAVLGFAVTAPCGDGSMSQTLNRRDILTMQILKAISLGNYSSATLNKQLTLPKAVLKSALSSVPSASLRGTVSANDAAVKNLELVFRYVGYHITTARRSSLPISSLVNVLMPCPGSSRTRRAS